MLYTANVSSFDRTPTLYLMYTRPLIFQSLCVHDHPPPTLYLTTSLKCIPSTLSTPIVLATANPSSPLRMLLQWTPDRARAFSVEASFHSSLLPSPGPSQ